MNDPDDQLLRDALAAEATRAEGRPDWDDVVRRAERTPRRRPWPALPTVAAAIALVALVAGALAFFDDDPAVEVTTDPAPTPTTTDRDGSDDVPSPGRDLGPLDIPAGSPLPADQMVAIVERGGDEPTLDLVVTTRDGTVVRTLLSGVDASEGGLYNLQLSPDRRSALVARGTSACEGVVVALATDGTGTAVDVVAGNGAALSPDRSRLALDPRSSCLPRDQIEVVPVAGGRSTIYGEGGKPLAGIADDVDAVSGGLGSLTFLDAETLAYTAGAPRVGPLWVLDLETGTDRRGGEGSAFRWLAGRGDGTMDVVFDDGTSSFVGIADEDGVLVAEQAGAAVWFGSLTDGGLVRLGPDGRLLVAGEAVLVDVRAVVATDPRRQPAADPGTDELSAAEQDQARRTVDEFLAAFRAGDVDGQAARWSGYPAVDGDDAKRAALAQLGRDADWSTEEPVELLVHPAWAFQDADAAVTAIFSDPRDRPLSFLVAVGPGPSEGQIHRLPDATTASSPEPAPGSTVVPGASIAVPGIPVEGGARAFIDDREVLVAVDHDALEMTVTIPTDATGRITLVLTTATPEEPAVQSWTYFVG